MREEDGCVGVGGGGVTGWREGEDGRVRYLGIFGGFCRCGRIGGGDEGVL